MPVGFFRRLFRGGHGQRASKSVLSTLDPQLPVNRLRSVPSASVEKELLSFSEKQVIKGFKFGVLFAQEDQTKEDEMFANGTTRSLIQWCRAIDRSVLVVTFLDDARAHYVLCRCS